MGLNSLSWSKHDLNTQLGVSHDFLIGTLGTNFSEILSEIHTFQFKKMHLKTSSAKRRPFCLGLSVLMALCEDGPMVINAEGVSMPWHHHAVKPISDDVSKIKANASK